MTLRYDAARALPPLTAELNVAYGWSFIAHIYHQVTDGSRGWTRTVCCGERWIDRTSPAEPYDLMPCQGQESRDLLAQHRRCRAEGCNGIRTWRGFCSMHYARARMAD